VALAEGRLDDALRFADESVTTAQRADLPDALLEALTWRRQVHLARRTIAQAVIDARQTIGVIEKLRAGTVPDDRFKTTFQDGFAPYFDSAIDLLLRTGRTREALEVSERGRARAVADLLATHERRWSAAVDVHPLDRATALQSTVSAPPLAWPQLVAAAARLHSTIVSYWVNDHLTTIFTVDSVGALHVARIKVDRAALARLV